MKDKNKKKNKMIKYLIIRYEIRKRWCIISRSAVTFKSGTVLQNDFEEHIKEYALSISKRKHIVLFGWIVDESNNKKEFLYDRYFDKYVEINIYNKADLLLKIKSFNTELEPKENEKTVQRQYYKLVTQIIAKYVMENITEVISHIKDIFDNFFN